MDYFEIPLSRDRIVIRDANGFFIADAIAEPEAEFIVTAVNAYDANQALIKQLVEALEYSVYCIVSDGTHSADMPKAALDAARKAGF